MANHTIRIIMQSFEEMLIQMPFRKVTVSALVERCEISSNTFYYHFRDIYDLLDAWLALKEKKFIDMINIIENWSESLKRIMKAMQDNPKLIYHIYDSIPRDRLERFVFERTQDRFYEVAKKRVGDTPVSKDFVRNLGGFYCYSVLGFVLKFLWDHMEADVDKSVEQIKDVFDGVTEYMIAKEMGSLR